jgi:MFS family permease
MFIRQKQIFNRPLKIMLSTNRLILIAGAMLAPIYAIFVERVGGDLLDASLAGGVFALAAGIASVLSGKFSDKMKENELIVCFGYTIVGLGFILYLFCDSVIFLLVIQIIIGLGEAVYSPAFDAVYSKHLEKRSAGKQWGAWESMNYFTAAAGAIIGGLIVTFFSFNVLFITMALLCFISAIYIYQLPRKVL